MYGFNIARIAFGALLSTLLVSCQITGPSIVSLPRPAQQPAPPIKPQGIEGAWIGSDGIGISSFRNGRYTVTASDTGNRLAEGSYSRTTPTLVAVNFKSLLRGTTINANCQLMNPQQLNCTTSTGAQLILRRYAGTVPA